MSNVNSCRLYHLGFKAYSQVPFYLLCVGFRKILIVLLIHAGDTESHTGVLPNKSVDELKSYKTFLSFLSFFKPLSVHIQAKLDQENLQRMVR